MLVVQQSTVLKLFQGVTVVAGGSSLSDAIQLSGTIGYFSIQLLITGDGTVKFEWLSSNDGLTFLDVNTDIVTGQTKTSGPGSDGNNMVSFSPVPSAFGKLKVTETGGVNAAVVTVAAKII